MWFRNLTKVCQKYGYSFDLFGSYDGVYLTLYPHEGHSHIELCDSRGYYNDLFKRAIRAIRLQK